MQRYNLRKPVRRKSKSLRRLAGLLFVFIVAALAWRGLRALERGVVRDTTRTVGLLPNVPPHTLPALKTRATGADSGSADRVLTELHVASVTTPPLSGAPPGGPAPGFSDPAPFPRPVQNVFEAQLALARLGISPGSLDGTAGSRTRQALLAFQQRENLPATGDLDASTRGRLLLTVPPLTNFIVAADDLARLRPLGKGWLEKSQQDRLDYETILELAAEKAQSHWRLIRQLNPAVDWTNLVAGTSLTIPNAGLPPVREKAALARIRLEERTLQVFGEGANLLAHFPCSIAAFAEKRPAGELHVVTIALDPNYTFDPDNFPESAEARQLNRKLILPPGPNNPVGTVWVGLDKPGYGIHGTPRPEQVGRAESHGCFRLANWNAEFFSRLVWVGMPVRVEP